MNIETCYKYFEFLNNECDRYLKDRHISEEEISQMKIELDRFLEKANGSDLPIEIKDKIADLKLDYVFSPNRESRSFLVLLMFGRSAQRIRERKLKIKVEEFKNQISGLPIFIRMNY
jgi:hypothetical protein